MDLVGRLRVPAFLLDVYSDVLAANYIAFTFFQVPLEMVQNAASVPLWDGALPARVSAMLCTIAVTIDSIM